MDIYVELVHVFVIILFGKKSNLYLVEMRKLWIIQVLKWKEGGIFPENKCSAYKI